MLGKSLSCYRWVPRRTRIKPATSWLKMPFALLVLILISYWEQWYPARKSLRMSIQTLSQGCGSSTFWSWALEPAEHGVFAHQVPWAPQLLNASCAAKRTQKGQMASTGAQLLPRSAVLTNQWLSREWHSDPPLVTCHIYTFLSSLGNTAFPFMLAMEVQVDPSTDSKVLTSSYNV